MEESSDDAPTKLEELKQFIVNTASDYVLRYSIDTGLNLVQALCGLASVGGLGVLAGRSMATRARPVVPLYRRLHGESGPHVQQHRRLHFHVNPYAELSRSQAVILQGRTQTGKTTLLRTKIPRAHRWNVVGVKWLCWHGLYLNGADAFRNETFALWVTSQMFGESAAAGSELKVRLWEWRIGQWFRRYMEILRMPFLLPRPVYIIVDQFEELLRKFPNEALNWADTVTNYHTRNNLARVVFVVNSDEGTQSLLNLDWRGAKYKVVKLDPEIHVTVPEVSSVCPLLFTECRRNVGLHTTVQQKVAEEQLAKEDIPAFVQSRIARWELQFQVPFAMHYHPSWLGLTLPVAKARVASGLEVLLRVPEQPEERNAEKIQSIMGVVNGNLKRLDARQFFFLTQTELVDALTNRWTAKPGLSTMDAIVVAKHIKRIMGNPVGWV